MDVSKFDERSIARMLKRFENMLNKVLYQHASYVLTCTIKSLLHYRQ